MTEDYTDEQAREAIALCQKMAETLRGKHGDWSDSEVDAVTCVQPNDILKRILTFTKPPKSPEPKRWPVSIAGESAYAEVEADDTVRFHRRGDDDEVWADFYGMDRLFVAWAAERNIDLEIAEACVGQGVEFYETTSREYVAASQTTNAIRAVLDNARGSD